MDDVLKILHFQILHAPAAGADKVTVGIGPAVETVGSAKAFKLLDFSNIGQEREIAVNSSKTDIGIYDLHIFIYRICGRMIRTGHKKFLDGFSLTAVFQCGHKLTPFFSGLYLQLLY